MMTCYDAAFAGIMDGLVDMLLVGDSVANVCLGEASTRGVGMDAMVHHTRAVKRGASLSLVVADMPFGSYVVLEDALRSAARLMAEGGADAVKLEGGQKVAPIVRALVDAGIPVVGHVGLLPQTAAGSTGFRVQGASALEAERLVTDVVALAEAGASAVVLEMVPDEVAAAATERLRDAGVASIGIGAGPACSGQVLVLHDALGLVPPGKRAPRFSKTFATPRLASVVRDAVSRYASDVQSGHFPGPAQSYPMRPKALARFREMRKVDMTHMLDRPAQSPMPVDWHAASLAGEPAGAADAGRPMVTVVGAGAMGLAFAGALSRAGAATVRVLSRRGEAARDLARGGVSFTVAGADGGADSWHAACEEAGISGRHSEPGPAPSAAVVVVAVRNDPDELVRAAEACRSDMPRGGVVVALQNGMGAAQALQRRLGAGYSVVDCVTTVGASLSRSGDAAAVSVLTGGPTVVGPATPGCDDGPASVVAAMFEKAGLPVAVVGADALASRRLRKLGVTCTLVAAAAAAGLPNGEAMLAGGATAAAARALAEEVSPLLRLLAARAAGDGDDDGPGADDGDLSANYDDMSADGLFAAAQQVALDTAGNTCSLLASRRRGSDAEVRATIGWALDEGERAGLSMPRLEAVATCLHAAAVALAPP